jgi:flavin-dependent dehydrogenase
VENREYNVCYLTTAENIRNHANSIGQMEEQVLAVNPFLREIFQKGKRLTKQPITISQISFAGKSQVDNHVLMVGDAAGMITPLCGNGMSMALHGSKIVYRVGSLFLQDRISREKLEDQYQRLWKKEFAKRLWMGRVIQKMSLRPFWLSMLMKTGKAFPSALDWMIRQTHGKRF